MITDETFGSSDNCSEAILNDMSGDVQLASPRATLDVNGVTSLNLYNSDIPYFHFSSPIKSKSSFPECSSVSQPIPVITSKNRHTFLGETTL